MMKTNFVVCLGVVIVGAAFVASGCSSDAVNSVTTTTSVSSSSSSGNGGAGGEAGAGGMMSGGAGGMGGAMAGSGGMGGAGQTCMKPADTCGSCLFDQCQIAYCDCSNEPACFGLIGCIQACPPMMPDCINGCYATNSMGFAEFTIASSCASTLCAPSCPGTDQVKPCDLCLAQKCETPLESCLANTQCFPLIDCRKNCMGNMTCEQQCDMTYPNGVPLVQAIFSCATTGCPTTCN